MAARVARMLVASLGVSAALAAAACKTSSPYATPANAAIGTGLAVGAAAVNRAVTHECWGACRPGMVCDRATGLCVEPGHRSNAGGSAGAGPDTGSPAVMTSEPYPAGHEYVVPPVGADAGCASASAGSSSSSEGDGGALYCEMDGGGS